MQRICMVGTGYVGLVTGACLADFGNEVTCVDADEAKIKSLEGGRVPFYEFGLEELLERNVREGRIKFSTDLPTAIRDNQVLFICVGTPRGTDGEADLQYVFQVAEEIARNINEYKVIVQKSTVPVGTGAYVQDLIQAQRNGNHDFDVAGWCDSTDLTGFVASDIEEAVGTERQTIRQHIGELGNHLARPR